jgi:hypothetical protein
MKNRAAVAANASAMTARIEDGQRQESSARKKVRDSKMKDEGTE